MNKLRDFFSVVLVAGLSLSGSAQTPGSCSNVTLGALGSLNGWVPSPNDAWHQSIVNAPIDPMSANILSFSQDLGGSYLTPNFSAPADGGAGIPYTVVDSSVTPLISISASDLFDSDNTLYPLPANVPIEGTPGQCWNDSNLHRALVLDRNLCVGYEVKQADPCNGGWTSSSNVIWDFTRTVQRPYGMSSADAAGLSIFEGLLRYDEIVAGVIQHALRFTAASTKTDANGGYFTAPATHAAGNLSSTDNIMGMRLRLRADFDISGFSATNQIILKAMQQYGIILADNGPNMSIEGTPDPRWNDSDLSALKNIPASAFDVVQMGPVYDSTTAPTGAAPQIVSFTASQSNITSGTSVVLTPVVTGGSSMFIDAVGFIRGPVTVTPQTTMTYTLTSRNAYGSSTGSVTVNVQGTTPTLTFAPVPGMNLGAPPFTVSATSNSPGAITYSVVSGPATISGNTVTLTGPGTVTLLASQAAAGGNTAATATTSFTVNSLARARVTSQPALVSGATSTGTASSPINTTGASIILACTQAQGVSAPPTDSQSNTWSLVGSSNGGYGSVEMWAAYNPSTSPSHTFSGPGGQYAATIAAYSNVASGPDQQSGAFVGVASSIQPGSITPTHADELIHECVSSGFNGSNTFSISGATLIDNVSGGIGAPLGSGYAVQTSAAASNPTWTLGTAAAVAAFHASFYGIESPAPPVMGTTSLSEGANGVAYTFALNITGGVRPYTCTLTSGMLPAWATLNASACTITGTPTTGTTSGLVIKATDSTSPAPQTASTPSMTLTIAASPLAVTASMGPCTQNVYCSPGSASAAGGTPPYTYGVVDQSTPQGQYLPWWSALPAGMSINSSTGAVTGTPAGQGIYGSSTYHRIGFFVTDAAGATTIIPTAVPISVAGNNTFGGAQLGPNDWIFHLNVSSLPVDTSPYAVINSAYQGAALIPLFGQEEEGGGIPINTVPYNQPNATVVSCVGFGCANNFFTSAPINCNAEIEGGYNNATFLFTSGYADNHIPTVQLAGGGNPMGLFETYQYYNSPYNATNCTYSNGSGLGGYSNYAVPLSGPGAYALTNGAGSTDAAGLPVAPLLLNYDEVAGGCAQGSECGAVMHPVRFTLQHSLNDHVWPATTQAGLGVGSCGSLVGGYQDPTLDNLLAQASTTGNKTAGYGPPHCSGTYSGAGSLYNPMGEIYRLKAGVATPSACSSNPVTNIIVAGFRNYGIILADNGENGAIIGTPDSRWPVDSVLSACLSALTLANFEPVQVDECANNWPNSSQADGCAGGLVVPTLAFATVANQTVGAAPFTVSATSNSSGAITYSVVGGPANISGNAITVTGVGIVNLLASQAAAGSYSAGTATTSFSVNGTAPSLAFLGIASQTYGVAPFTVSAASNSSGAITYSVVSGPAAISGNTVTLTGAGTVTLQASQAAAGNYAAATATASFSVAGLTPTLAFATVANQAHGAAPFTVSATSNSSGAITYSVVSGPATVSGSTVTLTGAGTVTLQASQAAAGGYAAATATTSFTVSGATPTLAFAAISSKTYGAAPFTVSASSNSSGAITYSVTGGPATNSGSTITVNGVGTVTLQASQAAAGSYAAGTATTSFSVNPAAPTLAFTAVANQTYGVAPFTVSATSNSSGAISYSVVSGPATISGSTVTVTGAGTVAVQASQTAAGNYAAGTATASFSVNGSAPTLTFAAVANQAYGVAPFTVSATSNSSGAITYSVVSGPATISGNAVTITGAGTVALQASQAASGGYNAATATTSFSVSGTAPTLTFAAVANKTYGAAPFTVSATSNSSGAVTYSVVSGPATASGSTVTLTGAGTVTLQASQAPAGGYTAATATTSFSVSAVTPTLTFTISGKTYGVAPFTVSATSNSSGAITYSVVSGSATVSGSTVTLTGIGTVTVQASQAAAGGYLAATTTTSFSVGAATPALAFAAVASQVYGAAPFTISATSNSSGAITYSVVSGPATVSGSTVTLTGIGTVTLQASQAAAGNYAAAAATVSFSISAASPALAFTAIASQTAGAAPFTVSATSNSSGAITYSVASGPATISGNTVTLTGSGTVTLQASQAAAGDYTAATATTSFSVAAAATANFSLPASVPTITVTQGDSGSVVIPVTSENGFSGTVTLGCTLPSSMPAASCDATSASLKAATTANSDVNVSTASSSSASSQYREPFGGHARGLVFLGLLAPFGLPLWRRRKTAWVRLVLCLMFAVGLSGCNLKSLLAMTPPGTYTVTVNATSGKLSHSMNLTVVVQ